MSRLRALVVALVFLPTLAHARPIITEEVATLGRFNFEAGASLSYRTDHFSPGDREYVTTYFPISARFGLTNKLDIGFTVQSINQHYDIGSSHYSGAISGDFSSEFKYSPWEHAGIEGKWLLAKSEDTTQQLSITHGNDLELNALFTGPDARIKTYMNVGYVWRGHYDSQFGVALGPGYNVEPGNIFQTRVAAETPLYRRLNALVEGAYYNFSQQKINGIGLPNSSGNALDILTGLTWAYEGWNMGAGISWGLLDEQHTSFDLTRGAGDVTYSFKLSYKLKAHKPEAQ